MTLPRSVEVESLVLSLASGTLHVLSTAPARGSLASRVPVLCLPGLSANARSFDALAMRLAEGGQRVVAFDLRGRGGSPATAPGTFGWERHALDVLEAARLLAFPSFVLVGHSMGAFVAMQAAALEASRIQRLVLIDGIGRPEAGVIPPILAAVERLGRVYASAQEYCEGIRRHGAVVPWDQLWEQHYLAELEEVPGGVRPRTSKAAVMEDALYGATHDAREFWPRLRMPTLLVRASQHLLPGTGFVVGSALRDAFLAAVPSAELIEVEANHYGVLAHAAALEAIANFLAHATAA